MDLKLQAEATGSNASARACRTSTSFVYTGAAGVSCEREGKGRDKGQTRAH